MPKDNLNLLVAHESPDPDFPGRVWLPRNLTAAHYLRHWHKLPETQEEADKRPPVFRLFDARKEVVEKWEITGLTPEHREKAENMPRMRLIYWINGLVADLFDEAADPKKWPVQSGNG